MPSLRTLREQSLRVGKIRFRPTAIRGQGPRECCGRAPDVIAAPRAGLVSGLVEQMFIQVTLINSSARIWHVDVNNPTNCTIEAELVVSMPEAAGLVVAGDVATVSVSVGPGQMLNVM